MNAFKKLQTFFFLEKKHSFFINFPIFSHVQVFQNNFQKKHTTRVEKIFLGNNTSWYAFYNKLVTLRDFSKSSVFLKKLTYFLEGNRTLNVLRYHSVSVAFYDNFTTNWSIRFSRSEAWTNMPMWRESNWQISGKKNDGQGPFEKKFSFHILNKKA